MVKFGPVVSEEKIFVKVNDDGRTPDAGLRTPSDEKSSPDPLGQVS